MTRQATISISEENEDIPEEKEFFELIENYGDKFHQLIHAANQSRFLGNVSFRDYRFRCSYGFPSFKDKNTIFVSKRNIDKRDISANSFVPVSLEDIDNKIPYLGDHKPSVDTPIQRQLYKTFSNIRFMIHAHVYIEDALYTKTPIPCGSLEEFDEIMSVIGEDTEKDFYAVNLIGHGCIVMSNDIQKLKDLKYIKRESIEVVK
jgi:ribulose-5-phosphate 4-epimerase/fuculose-1-phosphate aldolase